MNVLTNLRADQELTPEGKSMILFTRFDGFYSVIQGIWARDLAPTSRLRHTDAHPNRLCYKDGNLLR